MGRQIRRFCGSISRKNKCLDFGDPLDVACGHDPNGTRNALNSKGKPWASLKGSFAAARDRQIEAVHEDTTMPEAWKGDIEQAHRDSYARLIDTLVKLFKSCLTERSATGFAG